MPGTSTSFVTPTSRFMQRVHVLLTQPILDLSSRNITLSFPFDRSVRSIHATETYGMAWIEINAGQFFLHRRTRVFAR